MPHHTRRLLIALLVVAAACGGSPDDEADDATTTTTTTERTEVDADGGQSPPPDPDGGDTADEARANTLALAEAGDRAVVLEGWCYRDLQPSDGLGEGFHMHGTFTDGSTFAVTVASGKVELFAFTDRSRSEPIRYKHPRAGVEAELTGSVLVLEDLPVVGPGGERDTISFRVDAERPPRGQCDALAAG